MTTKPREYVAEGTIYPESDKEYKSNNLIGGVDLIAPGSSSPVPGYEHRTVGVEYPFTLNAFCIDEGANSDLMVAYVYCGMLSCWHAEPIPSTEFKMPIKVEAPGKIQRGINLFAILVNKSNTPIKVRVRFIGEEDVADAPKIAASAHA